MKNKFSNNLSSGFTLIELLVVIAIIGILSSVVLASLNTARNKGADAAVKSNMANARAQAELFYDANVNSYAGVCGAAAVGGVKSIRENVVAAGVATGAVLTNYVAATAGTLVTTVTCHDSAGAWAAEAPLKAGGMYCVDSTGASKPEPGVLAGGAFVCT